MGKSVSRALKKVFRGPSKPKEPKAEPAQPAAVPAAAVVEAPKEVETVAEDTESSKRKVQAGGKGRLTVARKAGRSSGLNI